MADVPPDTLDFQSHVGLAGLAELRPAWLSLLRRIPSTQRMCHNPFWYQCYLRHLVANDADMVFVGAYRQGQLAAVVPLTGRARSRWGFTLRTLELPSDRDLARGLCLRTVACHATAQGLARGDLLVLDHVMDDAHLFRACIRRLTHDDTTVVGRCYHHALAPGFAVRDVISSHFRKALNNKRNRLAKSGAVIHSASCTPTECEASINDFLGVEASGWKGRSGAGSALAFDASRVAFLRELLVGGDGLSCQIHLLRAGRKPVAAAFCTLLDRVLYVLHIGFDEQFARMSPGQLLIHDLLTWASLEGGIDEVNYLSGATWYDQWHPQSRDLCRTYGWPRNVRGLVATWAGRGATRWAGPRNEGGRRAWLRHSGRA